MICCVELCVLRLSREWCGAAAAADSADVLLPRLSNNFTVNVNRCHFVWKVLITVAIPLATTRVNLFDHFK